MRRLLLSAGLILVIHAAAATKATAQVLPLEHFQCYAVMKADPTPIVPVSLLDQFDEKEEVEAVRVRRFCNPVGKYHRGQFYPVQDISQHLTFYATYPQSGPLRIVTLSNQFDRPGTPQVWRVREGIALALPTHKPPHDRPEKLDHFRCYAASANPIGEGVGLIDQFLPFHGRLVIDPVMFCNPVQKTRLDTGEVTEVQHPELHLACYSTMRAKFQGTRDIDNQFGRQRLTLGPADTLCVPTRKISWVTIADVAPAVTTP